MGNVPQATFVESDLTDFEFPASSLAVVTAFFSIIHVPREQHVDVFRSVGRWLQPGGVFLASLGKRGAAEDWDDNWLGAPMFWSYEDPEQATTHVVEAGLVIENASLETIEDGIDGPETFFWVLATKPEN